MSICWLEVLFVNSYPDIKHDIFVDPVHATEPILNNTSAISSDLVDKTMPDAGPWHSVKTDRSDQEPMKLATRLVNAPIT